MYLVFFLLFFPVVLLQWAEYILFASLLVLVCVIFAVMAYFYTYTDPAKVEAQFAQKGREEEKRRRRSDSSRTESFERRNEGRRSSDPSSDEERVTQTKM